LSLDEYEEFSYENDIDMPSKNLIFNLSADQCQKIQPKEVVYKLTKSHQSSRSYLCMGVHALFLYYHCNNQIHIYRNYCGNVSYPKLIIDAKGSAVKPFTKFGREKTKCIFLYEALKK